MSARRGRTRGYNLVALAMAVAVMDILIAAALPLWSTAIRRDKEEELISRGLQYAEAIRVFQKRFGRLPTRLEELLEVEPRSIRQLWDDPMTEKGRWRLIIEGMGVPVQAPRPPTGIGGDPSVVPPSDEGVPGLEPPADDADEDKAEGGFGAPKPPAGPIKGVRSRSREEAVKVFCNESRYDRWLFTNDLLTAAPAIPGQPSPRLNATLIGRPYRPGLVAGKCGGMIGPIGTGRPGVKPPDGTGPGGG